MRLREQSLMRFRIKVRVRWFSVGPRALRGGPAVWNMRFRVQRLMRFRLRVRVRWFSVGPRALRGGPAGGANPGG